MLDGYITEINGYYSNKKTNLGETERNFLNMFQDGPTSAYGIYKYLEKHKRRIAYKNVHKTVNKLVDFELIRISPVKKLYKHFGILREHNANYYELTDRGLFYLLLYKFSDLRPDLLIQFRDNIILKTILFQYFEEETIYRLTPRLYYAIALYLVECCTLSLTEAAFIRLEKDKQKKETRIENLKSDLEWKAKTLAIELAMKSDNLNRHDIHDYSNNTISYLKRDKRFLKLLETVKRESEDGIKELLPNV